ncbi:MAG TPA: hypothetical protein PK948_02035 [Gemmatimonadales bacterium]|jgi:hypothetical protein|nr:hypothetical protein [Gemmatimonadales bacterium]
MAENATPKPVTLPRLLEELHQMSDMRANGELNADQFEARFARMIGELRDRRIDAGRADILQALAPLATDGTLRPEEHFRLTKKLGLV